VGIQFGGATGQIKFRNFPAIQIGKHRIDDLTIHHFIALGAGIDVTVLALEIAAVPQVDLEGIEKVTSQGREIGLGKQGQGREHAGSLSAHVAAGHVIDASCPTATRCGHHEVWFNRADGC